MSVSGLGGSDPGPGRASTGVNVKNSVLFNFRVQFYFNKIFQLRREGTHPMPPPWLRHCLLPVRTTVRPRPLIGLIVMLTCPSVARIEPSGKCGTVRAALVIVIISKERLPVDCRASSIKYMHYYIHIK